MAEVSNYPIPTYNYRVRIDGATISFSEVSGLDLSYESITYKESPGDGQPSNAGPSIYYLQGQRQAVNISLKKGLLRKESKEVLWDWFIQHYNNQPLLKKNVAIDLLDETGSQVVTWEVQNAFPTKISAPSFDANSNDVAVESMDLMADWISMSNPNL
ncbi:MAG: phage tail protein [Bacteroidota bacterium]